MSTEDGNAFNYDIRLFTAGVKRYEVEGDIKKASAGVG
jgi:hypothetical protein